MARRTVRATIPINQPNKFSRLLNQIVKYDNSLGAKSILKADPSIDMNAFAANLAKADSLRAQSEALKAQSEDLMQQAKTLYGTAPGQSINTPGTLYCQVDLIKKTLLKTYKGSEEALGEYGYNVVISQTKSPVYKTKPGRKKKPAAGVGL
jgi:hypothetical protein